MSRPERKLCLRPGCTFGINNNPRPRRGSGMEDSVPPPVIWHFNPRPDNRSGIGAAWRNLLSHDPGLRYQYGKKLQLKPDKLPGWPAALFPRTGWLPHPRSFFLLEGIFFPHAAWQELPVIVPRKKGNSVPFSAVPLVQGRPQGVVPVPEFPDEIHFRIFISV